MCRGQKKKTPTKQKKRTFYTHTKCFSLLFVFPIRHTLNVYRIGNYMREREKRSTKKPFIFHILCFYKWYKHAPYTLLWLHFFLLPLWSDATIHLHVPANIIFKKLQSNLAFTSIFHVIVFFCIFIIWCVVVVSVFM